MISEVLDAGARALTCAAGGAILANQLDELFIDANYFLRGLHRRSQRAIPEDELRQAPPRRIAILVPAWKEAEVIEEMLHHNLETLDYDRARYDIFCGTYDNDPETQARVDAVARRAENVHKVVVPHAGPTSKADCLNWIYQGIVLEEQRRGQRFDILLMHDAEDLIHPLSLRLYATLIPRYDFVQTPVFSLDLALGRLVAATYVDEFAEHHLKDMLVRQAISGLVPSAGVGSAFARDAFEHIALSHGQRAFNTESLTEDYEIGLKFRLANKKVCFACRTVERANGEEYIATREFFPDRVSASVRQRSRWILGITLQTWRQLGWPGAPPVLYCLFRDRKALFTNTLLLCAYILVAYVAIRTGAALVTGASWSLTPKGHDAPVMRVLLHVNLVMLVWRAAMKAWLVGRLYGPAHGALSAPRMVLGNVISLAATARAVSQYVGHRITGRPLRWLKTAHVFPSFEALRARRPETQPLVSALPAPEVVGLPSEPLALSPAPDRRLRAPRTGLRRRRPQVTLVASHARSTPSSRTRRHEIHEKCRHRHRDPAGGHQARAPRARALAAARRPARARVDRAAPRDARSGARRLRPLSRRRPRDHEPGTDAP